MSPKSRLSRLDEIHQAAVEGRWGVRKLLFIGLLALSGCDLNPVWIAPEGTSDRQFQQDKYQGQRDEAFTRQRRIYFSCMESKGYTRES